MSRHVTGLKHLGVGPGWAWLGDRSEPEADRVITEPQGDDAECGKSCGLRGISQHSLRVLQDITVFPPQGPRPKALSHLCQLVNRVSREFDGVRKWALCV